MIPGKAIPVGGIYVAVVGLRASCTVTFFIFAL